MIFKKYIAVALLAIAGLLLVVEFSPITFAQQVGGGGGTIDTLDMWKSDGTNITQRTASKPIKITGLSTGLCLTLSGASILTTTSCGSGGGGGADPFNHPAANTSATTSALVVTNASSTFAGLLNVSTLNAYSMAGTSTFTGGLTVGTQELFVPPSGFIGINTVTPSELLHVNGNIGITSGSGLNLEAGGSSNTWGIGRNFGTVTRAMETGNYLGILARTASVANGIVLVGGNGLSIAEFDAMFYKTYFRGIVGLATTTPNAQMTIASSTGPQLSLADGNSADFSWLQRAINNNFYLATSTYAASSSVAALSINGTNGAFIFNAGATSTFSSGLQTTDINETGNATSTFFNGINVSSGCFSIAGVCVGGSGGGGSGTVAGTGSAGQIAYYTGATTVSPTSTIFINNTTGFIGLNGTTTPEAPLTLVETNLLQVPDFVIDGIAASTGAEMMLNRKSNLTEGNIDFATAGVINWQMGTQDNGTNNFELWDGNDNPALVVNTNNDVMIGTTTGNAEMTIWGDSSANDAMLNIVTSASSTAFTVLNNGNVGINGTSSPYAKLSIASVTTGDDTPTIVIDAANTTNGNADMAFNRANSGTAEANIDFNTAGQTFWQMGMANVVTAGNDFELDDGNSNLVMTILTGKNVTGFGTSTPFWELTSATGTAPQLALSDNNAADFAWTMRSIANSFFVATSTATATSTVADLSLNGRTGALTINAGATSTFSAGISVTDISETGGATSTFVNGIDASGGCFSIKGVCVGSSVAGSSASSTLLIDNNTFSGATTTFAKDVWIGKTSNLPNLIIGTSTPEYGRLAGDLIDARYSGNTPALIAAFNPNAGTCAGSGFLGAGNILALASDYAFFGFTNSGWTGSGCAVGNGTERPESTIISQPTGDMNFELASTSAAVAYKWYTTNTTLAATLTNGTGFFNFIKGAKDPNGQVLNPGDTFTVSTTTATGDFTSIQSAVNALPATGGKVHVRCGTYTLPTANAGIDIKVSGTLIEGEGTCTQLNFDKANTAAAIGWNVAGITNSKISDLYIHQTNATFGGIGIDASNTPLLVVDLVKIDGTATSTKIKDTANQSFYGSFTNMDLRDNTSCFDIGAGGNPVNDSLIQNVRCSPHSGNKGFGYYFDSTSVNGAQAWSLTNINSEPTGAATGLTAMYFGNAVDIQVNNAYVEGNAVAYNISANAQRITFNGGEFVTNTTYTNNGSNMQFLNFDREGVAQNILAASTSIVAVTGNDASVPQLSLYGNTNFAQAGDLVKLIFENGSDSGAGVHIINPGTGKSIQVDSGTTVLQKTGIGTSTPWAQFSQLSASSSLAFTPIRVMASIINAITYIFEEIDEWGHLITSGPVPVLSACGTSTISGNDRNGTITLIGVALTSCTMTFAHAYAAAPDCTVSDNTTASVADVDDTASTMTVGLSVGLNSGKVFYQCQQHQ